MLYSTSMVVEEEYGERRKWEKQGGDETVDESWPWGGRRYCAVKRGRGDRSRDGDRARESFLNSSFFLVV